MNKACGWVLALSVGVGVAAGVLGVSSRAEGSQGAEGEGPAGGERRAFVMPDTPQAWGGLGVCYGPLRDGQYPGGPEGPSEAQLREDLVLISKHWSMIRVYNSIGSTEQICRIIHEDKLPLRVLVGAWIAQESKPGPDGTPTDLKPELEALNKAEVAGAIKLAKQYPDVVAAVAIGNEAMVSWSAYRVPTSVIIKYLKQARAQVTQPVTTCDTDLFWASPESEAVAKECDFLALHSYAMWNKQVLKDSLPWTRKQIEATRAKHPDLPIVMTEVGWATSKGTQGDQAKLIVATPSEEDQELFFRAWRDWSTRAKFPSFYFEAFDENWKGGNEPEEVEKHWGVFKADRTPKMVMEGRH